MLPNRCQGMAPTTQTAPFCAEKESADGEAVQERRPGSFLVLSLRTRLLFERSPPPARLPIPDLLHQSHGRLPTIREHLPEEVSFPIFGQGSKVVQSLRVGNRLLVVRNRFLVFLTRGGIDDERVYRHLHLLRSTFQPPLDFSTVSIKSKVAALLSTQA